MRVLLVSPPFYRLLGSHYNGLHLGLSYIGAVLKQQGHTVALFNADYEPTNDYPNQSAIFSNFETYKDRLHINHSIWREVRDAIESFDPEVVGITMYTAAWKSAQNVARIAKDNGARVIVGGPHPTLSMGSGEMTQIPFFDSIVVGEGENMHLSELGVQFSPVGVPDLEKLPFPMRDGFVNGTGHMDLGNIITGRGCPNQCTYCASPAIWNRKVRFRLVENVLGELKAMHKAGISPIRFCDDTFNLDPDRTVALLTEVMREKLDIRWVCDARVDRLTEELLDLMALSGCERIKVGVESGSDRILKKVKKGLTVAKIRQGVELIQQSGIPFTAYLMCGFPDETDEDLEQTIELAKWMEADYYSVSVFTPYYGTEAYRELEGQGKLPHEKHWELFYHQSQEMIVNDKLSKEMVKRLLALNKGKERI